MRAEVLFNITFVYWKCKFISQNERGLVVLIASKQEKKKKLFYFDLKKSKETSMITCTQKGLYTNEKGWNK